MKPEATYTEEIVGVLVSRLERARAFPAHLLVEYAAVLDFWIAEIQHCLLVIDGYPARIEAMDKARQEQSWGRWTAGVRTLKPGLRTGDRKDLRNKLIDATQALLRRMFDERLIDESAVHRASTELQVDLSNICP